MTRSIREEEDDCLNKNIFSNRLNWPYDSPHSLRLSGRLFHTCGPAAAKVLFPKLLRVRLTTSVGSTQLSDTGVSDDLTVVSQYTGALPDKDRWTRRAAAQEASAAGGAQVPVTSLAVAF